MNSQGWQASHLGELCSIKTGKLDVNEGNAQGHFPFFTCSDEHYWIDTWAFEGESILVAGNGEFSVQFYSGKFNAYQRTYVIQPKVDAASSIYMRYLYYVVSTKVELFKGMSQGSIIKYLRLPQLEALEIPLPPVLTQRRIVAILEKAEAAREKRRQANQLTEQFLRSAFLEMFGDPLTNRKKWDISPMEKVCSKITDGTHFSPPPQESGVPYITAKHLKQTGLDFFLDPTYISRERHEEIYKRCDPVKGDVLYIKDGATTGIAAVNRYDFPFSMLSSLALLRPEPQIMNSGYLVTYLNSPRVKENILRQMAGGAIKRLTVAKIKHLSVVSPPLELQSRFAALVDKVESLRAKQRESEKELENLFNSLMQKAFKGELEFASEPK